MNKNEILEKVRFDILSTAEMRELDRLEKENSIEKGYVLMQAAGKAIFEKLCNLIEKGKLKKGDIFVFIGSGNNGGDGLVLAKLLLEKNIRAKVYCMKNPEDLKNEAALAYKDFKESGGVYSLYSNEERIDLNHASIIVDALLGLGTVGELKENYKKLVAFLNESKVPVLAIDCPTIPLKATYTLVLGFCRNEMFEKESLKYYGDWEIAPLPYRQKNVEKFTKNIFGIREKDIRLLLPIRNEWGDKREQGTGLLISGSLGMVGASALCAKAALRSGIGLLSMAMPKSLYPVYATKLDEPVMLPYEDFQKGCLQIQNVNELELFLKHQTALAIGPGLSCKKDVVECVQDFIPKVSIPMILDADALNAFSDKSELLKNLKANIIITPHIREWERLFGKIPEHIEEKRTLLQEIAQTYHLTIILKGPISYVALQNGDVYRVGFPNSGMAKGGSGDVLTGILLALLASGLSVEQTALLGTWIHYKAGSLAKENLGVHSMLPSDVVEFLPQVFHELNQDF